MTSAPGVSNGSSTITLSKEELQILVKRAVTEHLNGSESIEDTNEQALLDDSVESGPEVSPALATTVIKRLTEKMANELMVKKKDCYKTVPGNLVKALSPTMVNVELWPIIPAHAKSRDKQYVYLNILIIIMYLNFISININFK